MSTRFSFDNSYARLPARFYIRQAPIAVAAPRLVFFNAPLAEALGLDAAALADAEAEYAAVLARVERSEERPEESQVAGRRLARAR